MNEGTGMTSGTQDLNRRNGTGDRELFFRNHISYIVEKAWTLILVLLAVMLGNEEIQNIVISFIKKQKLDEDMQMHLLWFLGGLLLFVILILWYLNRWYRTTMTVKDGTITYAKKTLTRKINTMSVNQISNVNIEQNIFEMICGTCKMRLDTDSLSTAEQTDLEMIIKKKKAEQVKKLILSMKEGWDGEDLQDTEQVEEYDIVYSTREMILNGLLSITVAQLFMAVSFLISFVVTLRVVVENVAQGDLEGVGASLVLLLSESVASYSIIWAMVKKMLQDFHFRARRQDNQIFVSCGLWKKKSYMVPVNKINAVKIEYPVIARIFGRGFLRVLNVGGEGEEVDGMKLLLLGTYDELKEKMDILLPEYTLPELKKQKKAPRQWMAIRGIYSVFVGIFTGTAAFVGLAVALGGPKKIQWQEGMICLGVGIAGLIFWFFLSFLTYKTYGMGCLDRDFLLVQGTFRKEVSLIPYDRIQYICYSQGPLERLFGLQHGYVSLLASVVSRYRQMGSFPVNDFELLEEKLRDTY